MEALGLGALFGGGAGVGAGSSLAGLAATTPMVGASVAPAVAGSSLGIGELLGAAGSMIPGVSPLVNGVTTLTDLLGPGSAIPQTFTDAFKMGTKVGGTMKDMLGGGSPVEAAPLVMPPPQPSMPGPASPSGGATPAARQVQSVAGYNSGYTPTANTTMRMMFGR